MAGFTFTKTAGDGGFKFREQSIFRDGMTFTITGSETGTWLKEDGSSANTDGSNSIRLLTSIGEPIGLGRLLNKKNVVYNESGRASILYAAGFHDELVNFLENTIGRSSTDSRFLNGSAKEIADRIVGEFFKDKTIVCRKADVFFKTIKDGVEKLEPPYSDIIVFEFK